MLWMEIVRRLGDKEKGSSCSDIFRKKGRANHKRIYNALYDGRIDEESGIYAYV